MYQIMIVEDDATMAEMMKRQLEAWGHQVHVAEQFQDILGEFTACAPHMVLMDIMLPFFNGYHWCMMAKIQAVLRRTYDMAGRIPVLEHQGAVLNLSDTTLTYQGKHLELTRNEFRILQTLLENKGKVVSREALMTKLWQMDCYVEENTLTVNVTRLRKKLESIGLHQWIRTKVGSGYWIPAEGQA